MPVNNIKPSHKLHRRGGRMNKRGHEEYLTDESVQDLELSSAPPDTYNSLCFKWSISSHQYEYDPNPHNPVIAKIGISQISDLLSKMGSEIEDYDILKATEKDNWMLVLCCCFLSLLCMCIYACVWWVGHVDKKSRKRATKIKAYLNSWSASLPQEMRISLKVSEYAAWFCLTDNSIQAPAGLMPVIMPPGGPIVFGQDQHAIGMPIQQQWQYYQHPPGDGMMIQGQNQQMHQPAQPGPQGEMMMQPHGQAYQPVLPNGIEMQPQH